MRWRARTNLAVAKFRGCGRYPSYWVNINKITLRSLLFGGSDGRRHPLLFIPVQTLFPKLYFKLPARPPARVTEPKQYNFFILLLRVLRYIHIHIHTVQGTETWTNFLSFFTAASPSAGVDITHHRTPGCGPTREFVGGRFRACNFSCNGPLRVFF